MRSFTRAPSHEVTRKPAPGRRTPTQALAGPQPALHPNFRLAADLPSQPSFAQAADPEAGTSRAAPPVMQRYARGVALPAAANRQCECSAEPPASARGPNRTGLPDRLKAGVEALSGVALDEARVRYRSPEPARLGAQAFARGRDIHLAPGQEHHLPHEAWHLMQQAQGRVKPTLQMKGAAVNDDDGLEREASLMGERAAAMAPVARAMVGLALAAGPVAQCGKVKRRLANVKKGGGGSRNSTATRRLSTNVRTQNEVYTNIPPPSNYASPSHHSSSSTTGSFSSGSRKSKSSLLSSSNHSVTAIKGSSASSATHRGADSIDRDSRAGEGAVEEQLKEGEDNRAGEGAVEEQLKEGEDNHAGEGAVEEQPMKGEDSRTSSQNVRLAKMQDKFKQTKYRPRCGKELAEQVWKNAQDRNGNVYDPNTGEQLFWDPTKKPRTWDLGHIRPYRKTREDYIKGRISWQRYLKICCDPANYRPESRSSNRSRRSHEKRGRPTDRDWIKELRALAKEQGRNDRQLVV